jgi:hypothetical protein
MRHLYVFLISITLLCGCMREPDNFTIIHVNPFVPRSTTCPTNYVSVPAVPGYTSSAFCVAKYEAKIISGKAVSQMAGLPTETRLKSQAAAACAANGSRYSLISNNQWQAVARTIEKIPRNWSSGLVGSGLLSLGHSDGDPMTGLEPGPDSDGCFGTRNTDCKPGTWHFQERTMYISSDQVIWDFAGNLPEWILDIQTLDVSSILAPGKNVSTLTVPSLIQTYGSGLVSRALLDTSTYGGLGAVKSELTLDGVAYGVIRGGSYDDTTDSGIFYADVNVPAETAQYDQSPRHIGFRCVYSP